MILRLSAMINHLPFL